MADEQSRLELSSSLQDYLQKLDILIDPEHQQANHDNSVADTLFTHQQQLRQLASFKVIGFMLADEDGIDFELSHWWPQSFSGDELNKIIDTHIDGGTFGLALQQNRPIVTATSHSGSQVLHVLTTQNKVEGLLIGITTAEQTSFDEFSLKLFSIIANNCAQNLERHSLSQQIAAHHSSLEATINERTRELTIAKEQAEAASQTKSQFISNMTHELRTPLTAVIGYAEAILDNLGNKPQSTDIDVNHIQAIDRSAKHLLSIINEVLDLSKIEAGHLELDPIEFCPAEIINHTRELSNILIGDKPLEFQLHYQFPLPKRIYSDPVRFKQILLNLCSNAVKFTERGKITLTISFDSNNQQLHAAIADQGIGIPPEQQALIFDAFQQGDASITRKFGGTGLGLFISKHLIQLLGGQLSLDSREGQGSTFSFNLDCGADASNTLAQNETELIDKPQSQAQLDIPKLHGKILLAEDWPENQQLIGMYLGATGVQQQLADNGEQAVQQALADSPDLILMDIQMPIMSGLEATKMLRDCGFTKPIVALTANALKEDVEHYRNNGFDAVLSKPIDRPSFYQTLAYYLPAASQQPAIKLPNTKRNPKYQLLCERFAASLPDTLAECRNHFDNQDDTELARVIHILKGSGGSFDHPEITRLAKLLETAIKSADRPLQQQLLSEMLDYTQSLDIVKAP